MLQRLKYSELLPSCCLS